MAALAKRRLTWAVLEATLRKTLGISCMFLWIILAALCFGAVFDDLMDQTRPWVTQEYLFRGTELNKLWQYSGCWFQTKNNNNWEAGGDAIITVECELAYVSRIRVAG